MRPEPVTTPSPRTRGPPADVVPLVHDEPVDLGERPLVEEELDPLPSGPLPGVVLAGDPLRPPAELGRRLRRVSSAKRSSRGIGAGS